VECLDPRKWHGAEALFDVHFRLTWQKRAKLETFLMGAAMQKSAGRFCPTLTPGADTETPHALLPSRGLKLQRQCPELPFMFLSSFSFPTDILHAQCVRRCCRR